MRSAHDTRDVTIRDDIRVLSVPVCMLTFWVSIALLWELLNPTSQSEEILLDLSQLLSNSTIGVHTVPEISTHI